MADYCTPTVVQESIPLAGMTPLEALILKSVFDSETVGGELYFFAEESPREDLFFERTELTEALRQLEQSPSCIADVVRGELDSAAAGAKEINLDLSVTGWAPIFQDIVRRSKTLSYISVMSAFTCSKMRPDGFGGMVTLIKPDAILSVSTNGILEKWLAGETP